MSLNIKRKEAQQLAQQLAKLTGENMAEAVTQALRERIARVDHKQSLTERWREIAKDTANRLREPYRSMTHEQLDDLLYDENGLPK
ncbi:MAG: type II toxin-antitoxin system VapB family antitoxin [Terriglobales bacterium]